MCSSKCEETFRSDKTLEFIRKARQKHLDKFCYDEVEYVKSVEKVKIKCLNGHGYFYQAPNNHLNGNGGCKECDRIYKSKKYSLNTNIFIFKAKQIHGDDFDYSEVDYKSSKNKVIITCNSCSEKFEQQANSHLRGSGCPKCWIKIRTSTLDEFLIKAKEIHGDNYGYSEVEYVNARTKVKIKCLNGHGIFEQEANAHLQGAGCAECHQISKKKTNEQFLEEIKKVHGNTYIYDNSVYTGSKNFIEIECREHGIFHQKASNHLSGRGCQECGREHVGNLLRSNTEEFIVKSKLIHGDLYGYDRVYYRTNTTKVEIYCDKHGYFEMIPSSHLNGFGCQKCGNENKVVWNKKTLDKFIEELRLIHGDTYDYCLSDYMDVMTPINIICHKHGLFKQIPSSHLRGSGCYHCSIEKTGFKLRTDETFIEASILKYGNIFGYKKVDYVNCRTPVLIKCLKHGYFSQTPIEHINGLVGCVDCKNTKSTGENMIMTFLDNNFLFYKKEKTFKECRHINMLKFDFYLSNYNLCIEFDGKQHFKAVDYFGGEEALNDIKFRDEIKNKYCLDNNINLLRIPYYEIKNTEKILYEYFKSFGEDNCSNI